MSTYNSTSTITVDLNKRQEQLIRDLAQVKSQLAAERQHNHKLSQKIIQLETQRAETPFKAAIKAAKVGVYSLNLQTGDTYWSPELLSIHGLKPDAPLLSKIGVSMDIHPTDPQKILFDFYSRFTCQNGTEYSSEHRLILPNEKTRWILVRGRIDFDVQKRPLRTHGIVIDITGRKQSEEALNHMAQFSEENPNPVLRCTCDGDLLYANKPAKCWLATLGWCGDGLLPEEIQIAVAKALEQEYTAESEITNAAGRTFNLYAVQPAGEDCINLYGIDTTARKQDEKALRESKEALAVERNKLKAVIEELPVGVRIENSHGITLTLNKASLKLHGFESEAEILNFLQECEKNFELRHLNGRIIPVEQWPAAKALRNEFVSNYQVRLRNIKVGSEYIVSYNTIPVRDNHGNIILRVYVMQDLTEQKHTEEALRESRRQLSTLLSNLPGMVYRCRNDPDWTMEFISDGCRTVTGYAPEEMLQNNLRSYAQIIHPADRQKGWNTIQAAIKERRPFQSIYRIVTAKGEKKWVWEQGQGVFNPEGKVVALEGYIADINELKRTEEALVASKKKYRDLLETANSIIIRWDKNGIIQFINEYGLNFFGYSKKELIGQPVMTIVPKIEKSTGRNLDTLVKETVIHPEQYTCVPNENITKEEKIVWVTWTNKAILDEKGNVLEILAIGNDITELKKTEAALRESEEKLRLFIKHAPVALAMFDGNMRYLAVSRRWITNYNLDDRNIIGRSHYEIFPDVPDRWKTAYHKGLKGKTLYKDEELYQRMDGSEHWERWEILPWHTVDGKIGGIIVFTEDVTERKQFENEKFAIERRKQQIVKVESLSRMAGAVAHHFNNMLTVVMGNLELVQEEPWVDKNISQFLKEAEQATSRAVEMSRLMLVFLGQSQGQAKAIDLAQICADRLAQLKKDVQEGVSLKINISESGPVIQADPAQIRQVLTNLVTNAWEAIDTRPGMVEVTIGSTTKAHIPEENRFPIEWKSSALFYAYLTITDTGRGMTAKTIQRIFDPFFTDKFTGRGLGLPVTLGIVKSSNGCIVVTSEPGCGSVLNVYWPLYLNSFSPAKKEPAIESPIIIGAGTVLLVEDKKAVRNMAKAILERLGFEVYTANNGLEAVKRFRANLDRIILVITDLTMPHMNGWETLIALRRLKSDIPVILVSGYNEKQAMTLDHEEQPQAFLHKPYHIKTLKSAIQKALGNKSLTVKTGKSKKCGII